MTSATGLQYTANSSGPSTDPCGTPTSSGTASDRCWPISTNCSRPLRYERSQSRGVSVTPNSDCRQSISSEWSTVSNTADRSRHVNFPTHNKNHILDMVITSSDCSLAPSLSSSHCSLSDHFRVFTRLSINPTLPPPTPHSFRRLHSIDIG